MFKKILLILSLCFFQSTIAYTNTIDVYCLVTKSDLLQAKIAKEDYSRFLGETIKLAIVLDESVIINTANLETDQTALFTGILDFVRFNKKDIGEFQTGRDANKKTTNTISYKHDITLTESDTKYNYNNMIRLINNVPVSIKLKVDQSGLSFNSWNFDVDCKGEDYSAEEIAKASTSSSTTMPAWFPDLVDKMQKEEQQQKNKKLNFDFVDKMQKEKQQQKNKK